MPMTRNSPMACLDLETFSTRPNAVVVQVGVALFTLDGGITNTYRANVRAQDQERRHLNADTVMWWLKQNERARASLSFPSPIPPVLMLEQVGPLLRGCEYVWACGPQFDLTIVNSLYRDAYEVDEDFIEWWKWRDMRPLRDLLQMRGELPARGDAEIEHDALGDAIYQTRVILAAMKP